MKTLVMVAATAIATVLASASAQAQTTVYNSTPADGWFYGSGNNYSPANTAVLTTANGNQLYLRNHITFQQAPASDGAGVYSFALGSSPISFDWGIDETFGGFDRSTALITLTNVGTGQVVSYNPFFPGNDNATGNGSSQNSARFNFGFLFGSNFNPNVDSTYRTTLSISGQALSIDARIGAGAATGAVPEPATWAMMIAGFGVVGGALRVRRRRVAFAA